MGLNPLGTLHPTKDEWRSLWLPADTPAIVLSFVTFNSEPFDEVFSWIRLRRVWDYGGSKLHEPSRKVYPSTDDLLLKFDTPVSSLQLSSAAVAIEVKKYYRFFAWPYTEPDWYCAVAGLG